MLFLAWKLPASDTDSAKDARRTLADGEAAKLFRVHSSTIAHGEAQALLTPHVALEQIAEAVWGDTSIPLATRWVLPRNAA